MNAYGQSTATSSPETSIKEATRRASQPSNSHGSSNGEPRGSSGILPQHDGLISIGEASRLYGVSPCKIRLATSSGALDCVRLPNANGGAAHRRFSPAHLSRWLGVPDSSRGSEGEEAKGETSPTRLRVALVSRVSGNIQTQKGADGESDLSRQEARLKKYQEEHYPGADVILYSRQASGINLSHHVLLKLLSDVMRRKLDVILCTYKDRMARWSIEIISLICSMHDCKLIFTEEDADKSDEQELADDLLAIIHIFSCRKYGARSGKKLKVNPPPDTLSLILNWAYVEKYSSYRIVEELKKAGKEHDDKGRVISRRIVRRLIADNKSFAAALESGSDLGTTGSASPAQSSIAAFCSACLRQTINGRRTLLFSKVRRAYRDFCKVKGFGEEETRKLLRFLKSRFPSCPVTRNEQSGNYTIGGLALHNLKS